MGSERRREKPGERPFRPWYVFAAAALFASFLWIVVPLPFVRGLVAGVVLALAVLAGVLFLVSRRLKRNLGDRLSPPPLPVSQWDYQLHARDLDGHEVDSARFKGRVLVLNVWATWCAPCVAEMPSLGRLASATADVDVSLACLTKEPAQKVRDFLAKRDFSVPVYLADGDIPACFQTRAIPATFVVDRSGWISLRHLGAAAWDDDAVIRFVRTLAAAPRLPS